MSLSNRVVSSTLSIVAAVAFAGCPSPDNMDGGDGGTSDVTQMDNAPPPDSGPDATPDAPPGMDSGPDATPDATMSDGAAEGGGGDGGDGGLCGPAGRLDPRLFIFGFQTVINDGSRIGGMSRAITISTIPRRFPTVDPVVMGNCSMMDTTMYQPTENFGNITSRQGTAMGTLTWDTTMMRYLASVAGLSTLMNDMDVTMTVDTPDAGMPSMATLRMPANTTVMSFNSTFTDPVMPTFSHSADTVVTWTPRNEDDLVMYMQIQQIPTPRYVIGCAVPACRGTLTVPAALIRMTDWVTRMDVRIQPRFQRRVEAAPARMPPVVFHATAQAAYEAPLLD